MLLAVGTAFCPVAGATLPLTTVPRCRAPLAKAVGMDIEQAAPLWKLMRNEDGGVLLEPADAGFEAIEYTVTVPRSAESPGLGIGLAEVGSSGDNGLVLVETLVEGGNAAAAGGILPGDALVAVGDVGAPRVDVEGLSYDRTMSALLDLDPTSGGAVIMVKRLSKVPAVQLTLRFPASEQRADERVRIFPGASVRRSILARGVKLNDPLARRFDSGGSGDCGGEGTCCTCVMDVTEGSEFLTEAKTQERQMLRKHPSWRLGCRAFVRPDLEEDVEMTVRVAPRGWGEEECAVEP